MQHVLNVLPPSCLEGLSAEVAIKIELNHKHQRRLETVPAGAVVVLIEASKQSFTGHSIILSHPRDPHGDDAR